mmetsp:Transcript_3839/g.13836  ORF Transcript_3839/g.13836 Transcript_3839/m.13836 type:complete len:217 (+) Transcript_3839:2501-3151(+)
MPSRTGAGADGNARNARLYQVKASEYRPFLYSNIPFHNIGVILSRPLSFNPRAWSTSFSPLAVSPRANSKCALPMTTTCSVALGMPSAIFKYVSALIKSSALVTTSVSPAALFAQYDAYKHSTAIRPYGSCPYTCSISSWSHTMSMSASNARQSPFLEYPSHTSTHALNGASSACNAPDTCSYCSGSASRSITTHSSGSLSKRTASSRVIASHPRR